MQASTKRLFSLLTSYKTCLVICIISSLLFVLGRTGLSLFIGDFINDIFIKQNFNALSAGQVFVLFAFGLLWTIAQYTMYLFSGKLAIRISYELRAQLYKKIIFLPISFYHNNKSSNVLSITTNDIMLIESFLMNIMVQLLAQPLTVITIVITMFIINWKLSLYFLILGPSIAFLLDMMGSHIQRLAVHIQENIAELTSIFAETMRHIQIIKGFNCENMELSQFDKKNTQYLELSDKEIKIRLLALPMSDFMGVTAIILILLLGAVGIRTGIASTGDVTKFVAMAIVLSEPISSSNQIILVLKKLFPAVSRVFKIIDLPEEQKSDLPNLQKTDGHIEFRAVSFSYKESPVLKEISLEILPRETIAIVGYSGSGKSTLVSLIPKFYSPNTGQILIDGKNIAEFSNSSLRENIAIVTQDTSLFTDTIYNNIILAKPNASMDELIEATKLANADKFILQNPAQFERHVGDLGNNLSGGERQRIILARAVLKKPAILILDEPTNSLDKDSEEQITRALERIYGHQTTLIIAHKLSTVRKVDKILLMKDGKIVGMGTHKKLIEENTYYQELCGGYNVN